MASDGARMTHIHAKRMRSCGDLVGQGSLDIKCRTGIGGKLRSSVSGILPMISVSNQLWICAKPIVQYIYQFTTMNEAKGCNRRSNVAYHACT